MGREVQVYLWSCVASVLFWIESLEPTVMASRATVMSLFDWLVWWTKRAVVAVGVAFNWTYWALGGGVVLVEKRYGRAVVDWPGGPSGPGGPGAPGAPSGPGGPGDP